MSEERFGVSPWVQGFDFGRDGRDLPPAPEHWSKRAAGSYQAGYRQARDTAATAAENAGYFIRKAMGSGEGFYAASPGGEYILRPEGGSIWQGREAAWQACVRDIHSGNGVNPKVAAILAQDERRMLVVSMQHVTRETGENPTAISWANVKPYQDGFICYCRFESCNDGDAPELLAIVRLARAYGYDYVMIDRDASAYDESVGLPIFDHD